MSRSHTYRRSAVILTALDVETRAVLRHLKRQGEKTIDGTVFYLGCFEAWDIAVAEAGAGNTSAAAIAERAMANFRPSVAAYLAAVTLHYLAMLLFWAALAVFGFLCSCKAAVERITLHYLLRKKCVVRGSHGCSG